jgi:SynChlorMet cassette protein ScmC
MNLSSYNLTLTDDNSWAIAGLDEAGAGIVSWLAGVMQLPPSPPGLVNGRRLLVAGSNFDYSEDVENLNKTNHDDHVCCLWPVKGEVTPDLHGLQVSLVLARETQRCGGLLLHGALAEFSASPESPSGAKGIILAAPGGTGKTTASSRLPSPWRALCDDTTLVARDKQGVYWAHPWPTWSRFMNGESGETWNVSQAVPLKAIFILSQAAAERIEPVGAGRAVTLLLESAEQASHLMGRLLDQESLRLLRLERFNNLCSLVKTVPVYILHLSLTGAFWEEIEQVLPR